MLNIKQLVLNDHRFTQAGLNGLVDHAEVANRVGELLASGRLTPSRVYALLEEVGGAETVDVQTFWNRTWADILGCAMDVPPVTLKERTVIAAQRFGFRLVRLPRLGEDDYPEGFVRPVWNRYLDESTITHRPLEGLWVLTETIAKPNWDDPAGYGDDPLARELGLESRFRVSWDDLHQKILPRVAKLLGLSPRAVRCPSAEEYNLIGNVFNWLREERGEDLPNLGSTNSWEWCENAYGSACRLIAGNRDYSGLEAVTSRWADQPLGDIGFRVLVVL